MNAAFFTDGKNRDAIRFVEADPSNPILHAEDFLKHRPQIVDAVLYFSLPCLRPSWHHAGQQNATSNILSS